MKEGIIVNVLKKGLSEDPFFRLKVEAIAVINIVIIYGVGVFRFTVDRKKR